MLSRQARRRVLRLVIIDEVRLHVQQGMTFREETHELITSFFLKVFSKSVPSQNPKSILATGTMRHNYVHLAASLTMLSLPPTALLWVKADDFAQRNISIEFHCNFAHTMRLDLVADFVKNDPTHFACVFVPSKAVSFVLQDNLEQKLDKAHVRVGVLHVHDSLAKEEKYWFIRIFYAGIDEEEFRGRILLATSAANAGIDNQLVTLVLGVGWCHDLCTYFQQRGRGGRDPTMQAKFLQLGSIQSYVSLVFQMYR